MVKWLIVGLSLLLPCAVIAGTIDYSVTINTNDIITQVLNNYDYVSIAGYDNIMEPGHPALPVKVFSFVLPCDAVVEDIEVINEQGGYLSGTFTIFPAQKPIPVSLTYKGEFTLPDEAIYSRNTLYPSTTIELLHEGSLSGYRIASVAVKPLRYNPSTKKLYISNHISFQIHYQGGAVTVQTISEAQKRLAQKRVATIVENKTDIDVYAPPMNRGLWDTEYFIITDPSFVDAFAPLKEWKTRRGVPTEIVTTSWIYGNYTGDDNPDQVRNFIKEAADSGAVYFLLAGQCDPEHGENYVPRRDTWCMTSGVGGYNDEDTIPCDLYFSDLDRDWDNDGDGVYGEATDWVDMYSDVYVGRAPVKNTNQIENFICKVISYEKSPSSDIIEKILLPVGNLWSGNHGNGINDTIADTIPDHWQKSKLYEDYGLMSTTIVKDSINQGYNLCHMVGHGNEWGIYYSTSYYDCADPPIQTNDSTEVIITGSMACFSGAVDKNGQANDCLAERMVNANKMCATATMMNTRYGWGYSSPQGALGPGGELCVWFFRKLFGTDAYHIGEVLAHAKDQKVPWAGNNYWRYTLYEFTLFGDPEMPIWTDSLKNLVVSFPDTISENFTVTVENASSPVSNALVTIMQDSTAYHRELTDGSGQAQFTFDGSSFDHEGYAWITVTNYKENFLPSLDSALVDPSINVYEVPPQDYTHYTVTVSPNPIKSIISVNFSAPLHTELTVKIYDIKGSLVKTATVYEGMSEINILTTRLNSGTYFLKTDGSIPLEEKIIIVK